MIERPKPLNLPNLEPKATLRAMLENSDKKDRGEKYSTPLAGLDPMTLDELMNRIDSGALALGQVPNPSDIEQLVGYYWSLREQFVLEQQMGLVSRPKRKPGESVVTLTKTVTQMLAEAEEKDEKEEEE